MVNKGIIVYVEEEYGYRYWKWNTGVSTEELIKWWNELESVDAFFFNPGETLPFGFVRQIGIDQFLVRCAGPRRCGSQCSADLESASVEQHLTTGIGTFIQLEKEKLEKERGNAEPYMHLHTDGDSRLTIGGIDYLHKGYDPEYFWRGNGK